MSVTSPLVRAEPTSWDAATMRASLSPVFAAIAKGAIERERDRRLPHEEIRWLLEAGFGKIRVPREYGGFGASLEQFFDLLIELGAADSNLVQALRGHIGFVEFTRTHPNEEFRRTWFARIAAGALVGNAESERTGSFAKQATEAVSRDGKLVLNGQKYYTTGSIFADWILVSAVLREGREDVPVTVLVPTTDPGVKITDDWDGFGQRLTGSGTTEFSRGPGGPRFA